MVAAPSVIGLADLLGVAQHRSDQVGSLSTFGMSDVDSDSENLAR